LEIKEVAEDEVELELMGLCVLEVIQMKILSLVKDWSMRMKGRDL
jgi:hypothetical protein